LLIWKRSDATRHQHGKRRQKQAEAIADKTQTGNRY
jgi:hypothetical protein